MAPVYPVVPGNTQGPRYGETHTANWEGPDHGVQRLAEEALDFYDGLAVDNSKSYWTEHKAVYQDKILRPMTELTEELAEEFGEPKIFRPYRDVRFSSDKTPYKTHIGAVVGRTGYIQLSAEGLGAGAGMWEMGPDRLARYREAVARDEPGAELEEIIAVIEKADVTVHGHGVLKSAPRGYPVDHPRIALLRYKGLTAWRQWPVEPWLETAAAKDRVISFFRTTLPLCSWLTDHVAVDGAPGRSGRRRDGRTLTAWYAESRKGPAVSEPDDSLRSPTPSVTRCWTPRRPRRRRAAHAGRAGRTGRAGATAKTRGELATLTSDLPADPGQPGPARQLPARTLKPVRWMVAIMSGSHRRGRVRAEGSVNSIAVMGGNEIDLREAEIEGGELTLNLFALMGGSNIYVPNSVEVETGGFSLMGGREEIGRQTTAASGRAADPDPGVQLSGRRDDLPPPAAGPRRGPEGGPAPRPGRRAR